MAQLFSISMYLHRKGNTSNSHLAKLEEKYEGIINTSSTGNQHRDIQNNHLHGVMNRKSRRQAVSTVESLALFSPQLILEDDDEDEDEETQPSDADHPLESLATITSSMDGAEEDEEFNSNKAIHEPIYSSTSISERETLKDDGNSHVYENLNSQPLHSSYYGTPIFIDPEIPQQKQNMYGSTGADGAHLGEVSWSHPKSADETTRLLGFGDKRASSDSLLGSKNGEEILRPSIFTTLGGLGAHNKFT